MLPSEYLYHKMLAHAMGDLRQEQCIFFLCDMQEKFRPAIKYFDDILEVNKRLVKVSEILEIPLVATEQYPKGLGSTVPELEISHAQGIFPKTKFCMMIPEVEQILYKTLKHVKQVVLFGVEAHVCILQTATELMTKKYEVFIVADGCSSRNQMDRLFAFESLRQAGCVITTSETVIMQLLREKEHPNFKEIQSIIRPLAPVSGLLPS